MEPDNELKNVPKLRFPVFSDKWIHKRLGELVNGVSSGKTKPMANGRFNVFGSTGIIGKCSKYTHHGDFLLVARVGANAGTINMAKGKFGVTDNTLIVDSKDTVDLQFVKSALVRYNLNRLVFGSGQPLITGGLLKAIKLHVPSLPEQQKIAAFLSAVDKKIQQLTRKKELLEQYKKGVMQKIFSQEIRFKPALSEVEGREDGSDYPDWEGKRLGEMAVFSKGKGISKDDVVLDGEFECIRYGQLYTTYSEIIENVVSRTSADSNGLKFSEANDVLIPSSGETHIDLATASCTTRDGIALGGDITIIRTKQNGVFLAYYLNNARKHKIAQLAQGNSVVHLYSTHLKTLQIDLPSLEEQDRIAGCLTNLAKRINWLQHEITQTQQFKKGLLQQMFV